jgi:adenylate cyclase 3
MDKVDRVIFMWKNEVSDQQEKASDMRERNEALVYNILPKHVAEHFMGNRKRSHDELYSQSYAEVGVLFASMPNFSDFYSEESVNNQGLECLRFLNEVISDFDALLELPQFQNIIKIKTIGSTYMAASGLNPSQVCSLDEPIAVRWAHLSLLVEFALELKKALQGINEQSFNHFVLKMGINHGPITAGVIGARKPHYDIWGNTGEPITFARLSRDENSEFSSVFFFLFNQVNVASRMESTGKAGAIQVTEETCQILQMFNYTFEQRGLVAVKGKGQLMTYYLQGKGKTDKPPTSPILQTIMQTVHEIEEFSPPPVITTTTVLTKPESPNPLTLSSATASPSSVRLNQNYQPNTDNEMNDNLESLDSNCEESINELKSANGSINHSEKDPLLNESPKIASTNHSSNHLRGDENDALLQNGA